jgi:hypothetical protein
LLKLGIEQLRRAFISQIEHWFQGDAGVESPVWLVHLSKGYPLPTDDLPVIDAKDKIVVRTPGLPRLAFCRQRRDTSPPASDGALEESDRKIDRSAYALNSFIVVFPSRFCML